MILIKTKNNDKTKQHTSTDAFSFAISCSMVALQSLGVVAWLVSTAVFIQLPGAHSAAAATIQHQTDSSGAPGYVMRTGTLRGTGR